jgi:hypothetical protein
MSQVVRPDAREVGAFERTVLRFDSLRVLLSATTRIAGEIERKYMTVGPCLMALFSASAKAYISFKPTCATVHAAHPRRTLVHRPTRGEAGTA